MISDPFGRKVLTRCNNLNAILCEIFLLDFKEKKYVIFTDKSWTKGLAARPQNWLLSLTTFLWNFFKSWIEKRRKWDKIHMPYIVG